SNKIRRAASVDVSWAGRSVESYQLQKDPGVIKSNLKATVDFISSLGDAYRTNRNNFLWQNVSPELMRPLFRKFKVPDTLVRVEPNNLLQFIDVQIANGELTRWSVGVMSKADTKERFR